MAFTYRYTLMCDDIRKEDSGKLIIIGLYLPDIVAPSIPIALQSLTFMQVADSDRPGQYSFRMRLQHMESGHQVVEAMGMISVQQPGEVISVVKFGNVKFDRLGMYHLVMTIEDNRDPMIFSFNVTLAPQPAPQQPQR